ncbi:MAG TPA: TonB family protein [Candidatus Acidoferrales bacterium]|nr:TonB family protein [Candidatus Acidoferrales bacterium]
MRSARTAAMVVLAALLCAATSSPLAIGGVTLGEPIGSVVSSFGAPGLVETTDQGQEWRWYDQNGLDVDLLTDDGLVVRQVLVAQPVSLDGQPSPLVQPPEFPLLETSVTVAAATLRRSGATPVIEPNPAVGAWRIGADYLVLQLANGSVRKLLALDRDAATRAGYIGAAQPVGAFHAPRLIQQYAVDYPRKAVQEHASGVVVVRADISATGAVTAVTVVVSSKNPDIDEAEVQSISRSKFRPALCDGVACAGVYLDREEYTLDD